MILETITWMSVKTFFKKVLAWCKKYWQFLVGASIPIVIWVLTRDSSKLDEVVDRIKEDHAGTCDDPRWRHGYDGVFSGVR